jgi:hypothetical protein
MPRETLYHSPPLHLCLVSNHDPSPRPRPSSPPPLPFPHFFLQPGISSGIHSLAIPCRRLAVSQCNAKSLCALINHRRLPTRPTQPAHRPTRKKQSMVANQPIPLSHHLPLNSLTTLLTLAPFAPFASPRGAPPPTPRRPNVPTHHTTHDSLSTSSCRTFHLRPSPSPPRRARLTASGLAGAEPSYVPLR